MKFTSKLIKEVVYGVVGEYWLDDDTYVIVFKDMTDADGDTYHLEVEYHKDENKVTYTRVYEYENISGDGWVSSCFRKQIYEYILHQVGVLQEDELITTKKVELALQIALPKNTTINQLTEWIESLDIKITPKDGEKIKVLEVKIK